MPTKQVRIVADLVGVADPVHLPASRPVDNFRDSGAVVTEWGAAWKAILSTSADEPLKSGLRP